MFRAAPDLPRFSSNIYQLLPHLFFLARWKPCVAPRASFGKVGLHYPALTRVRGRDCFPSCPSRTFSHRLQSHCRGCHDPPFGGWGVVLAFPFLPPTLFQVVKPFHCSSTQKHTYFKHEKGGIKGPFALGMSDPLMDQLNGRPID